MRRTHYLSMHDFASDGGEEREVDHLIPPLAAAQQFRRKRVNESTEEERVRERKDERPGNFSSRISCGGRGPKLITTAAAAAAAVACGGGQKMCLGRNFVINRGKGNDGGRRRRRRDALLASSVVFFRDRGMGGRQ